MKVLAVKSTHLNEASQSTISRKAVTCCVHRGKLKVFQEKGARRTGVFQVLCLSKGNHSGEETLRASQNVYKNYGYSSKYFVSLYRLTRKSRDFCYFNLERHPVSKSKFLIYGNMNLNFLKSD